MKNDMQPLSPDAANLEPPQGGLQSYPPSDRWSDWTEYDAAAWPRRVEKHYDLVPTICFNCEAGCGLLAYVDKETLKIRKFEGNPEHPGSRGRNCAKGPATINQVYDSERILYPMKRVGKRGGGQWERVSWDEVLDDMAARIRKALEEDRRNEIMYHVGRPGHELLYHQRIMHAWGIDAHNSHTNVCSAGARAGYAFWCGIDRPSPDHANARFMLMLSSHLETGHYFNPHAQRIIEAKERGAKVCVIDTRLSNTASQGRLLDAHLARHRSRGAAGHVQRPAPGRSLRPRVREEVGSTGSSSCARNTRTRPRPSSGSRRSSRPSTGSTRPSSPRPSPGWTRP